MDNKKTDPIEYYNSIATGYNDLHKEEQLKKLEIIKTIIKPKKNEILLDVGCGTGLSSDWNCKVIGIDPSIELLKQNNKLKIIGKGEYLPFKDNFFDYVISLSAIHNYEDPIKGIEEIKRVSKNISIITIQKRSKKKDDILQKIKAEFQTKIFQQDKDIITINFK